MIQINEENIVKALRHPDYFITSFCQIEATGKGLVPFELYEYQKEALGVYLRGNNSIVLKSRQMGFTTLAAAYALWKTFMPGNNILFLSKKEDDAMDIVRKVRIMYDNLPSELQLGVISSNQTTVEFTNKNRIQSLPATDRSGAGKSASLIIMDEFSAFPSAKGEIAGEDVWTSILPVISTGGQVIVQSTPKGMGNKYYQLWAGENKLEKIKFDWKDHPVYSLGLREKEHDMYGSWTSDWASEMMVNMTPDGWAQEFNCDFVQSGRPVFDWNSLIKNEVSGEWGNVVCGVDLASGSATDYHVAQFLDYDTGEQLECYRSQEPIDIFGEKVVEKCKMYSNALLAFENNSGYGLAFMKGVRDYQNLYYQVTYDKRRDKKTRKLGWNTNVKTKQLMITDLNLALINKNVKLTSEDTIKELKTYQYVDEDKMQAMAGCNDDCVMSLAIAWQALKSLIKDEGIENSELRLSGVRPSYINNGGEPVNEALFLMTPTKKDWRLA